MQYPLAHEMSCGSHKQQAKQKIKRKLFLTSWRGAYKRITKSNTLKLPIAALSAIKKTCTTNIKIKASGIRYIPLMIIKKEHIAVKAFIGFLLMSSFQSRITGQQIPTCFFSQNAWMPDSLGNTDACKGKPLGLNCKLYGKIHQGRTWDLVKQSGVKLVRFGGEHADENKPTLHQYLQMVDSIRANDMEPLLQVPYNNNYYTVDTALVILKYINITMNRKVKYWSIGNEPDLKPPNGYGYYTASPVADYIKLFSARMKEVDSTIIILGPDLKFYNDNNNLVTELTTPGGFYDITGKVPGHTYYYIDIFSFHSYPFGGEQTREQLVSNLRDPWHISHMLDLLNAKLDSCSKYHGRTKPLRAALTETNLNYQNSSDPELNAHSFIAGQFWCELMGVAMEKNVEFVSFWSIIENSLGYLDESWRPWPTYHHYMLMAQNFRGSYCTSEKRGDAKYLKVIAATDTAQITVMLLNQKNQSSKYRYTLQMGRGKIRAASGVQIHINNTGKLAGNIVYTDSIQDESTCLLIFSPSGKLLKKYEYKKSDSRHAKPKPVPVPRTTLFVCAGRDTTVQANKEIFLSAGKKYPNARYLWYEGESKTPLAHSSSGRLKVMPVRNTTYRLVVTYNECTVEDSVNIMVLNE